MLLDGIDIFVEVADAQSFTRAADRLGQPTTTVSRKIAKLEERLGTSLIRRTTRKLSLTEAGERYYAFCAQALKLVAEGEGALAQDATEPSGLLRLTAPPDLAQNLLAPVISAYLEKYPKVAMDLVISNEFVDLIEQKIDLAVRAGDLADSSLIIRKFVSGHLSLWASRAYLDRNGGPPKDAKALNKHRMVTLKTKRSDLSLLDENGRSFAVALPETLTLDDLQTCESFVEQGLGLGLLPEFSHAGTGRSDRLVPVLPHLRSPPVTVVFAYPNQSFVPMTVRSFIDTALEVLKPKTQN